MCDMLSQKTSANFCTRASCKTHCGYNGISDTCDEGIIIKTKIWIEWSKKCNIIEDSKTLVEGQQHTCYRNYTYHFKPRKTRYSGSIMKAQWAPNTRARNLLKSKHKFHYLNCSVTRSIEFHQHMRQQYYTFGKGKLHLGFAQANLVSIDTKCSAWAPLFIVTSLYEDELNFIIAWDNINEHWKLWNAFLDLFKTILSMFIQK